MLMVPTQGREHEVLLEICSYSYLCISLMPKLRLESLICTSKSNFCVIDIHSVFLTVWLILNYTVLLQEG